MIIGQPGRLKPAPGVRPVHAIILPAIMGVLKLIAFAGGEWAIWVLLALSVVALATALERAAFFFKQGVLLRSQADRFEAAFLASGPGTGKGAPPGAPFFARRVARIEPAKAAAARIEDRLALEERLVVLGSLGSLSPFIGLFGTVLGIIKAFRDLGEVGAGHPEIVMQGIAEALIATAVGILIAILCVASYNWFNRRIKEAFMAAERLELLHGTGHTGRR